MTWKLAYFGQTNVNRLNLQKTVEEEIMEAHPDHSRGAARKICGVMMFPGDDALKKSASSPAVRRAGCFLENCSSALPTC